MKFIYLFIFLVILSGCSKVGTGQRVGQIVKIASEGYFVKSTEVEIIKGSLNSGSGAFGSKFDFTIQNPSLIEICNKAFNDGKEVIVDYHSTAFCPLSSGSDDCNFADSINIK